VWLTPIPVGLREAAVAALDREDVVGFLTKASNDAGLSLVAKNVGELTERRLYEPALLHAWVGTRTNHIRCPMRVIRGLFEAADRERLRASGDPMPGEGPFTVYRGVAGRGPARRVRGISWTASLERAIWFARRYPNLADPAVYQLDVPQDAVLACVDDRQESEFLLLVDAAARPRLITGALRA
jgi:hypothetical protein